jgi:SNF2 family DNA or RNA helicase
MNPIMKPSEIITKALQHIDSQCDYASSNDNVGFNGTDASFCKSLAIQSQYVQLTFKQLATLLKILRKYQKTQLKNLILPSDTELNGEFDMVVASNNVTVIKKPVIETNKSLIRGIDLVRGFIRVYFDYDRQILQAVKSVSPKGSYKDDESGKYWIFPISALNPLLEKLEPYNFVLSDDLKNKIQENENKAIELEKTKSRMLRFVDKWVTKYQDGWRFPNGDVLNPYKHQIDGIKFMATRMSLKGCILADEQGLGKTYSGMMTAKFLQDYYVFDSGVKPMIIVICPKSLKDDWIKAASIIKCPISVYTFAKVPLPPESNKYIVIGDEVHAFQSMKSARTKKFLELVESENCLRVFPMTGTPMNNGRPSNIYPLLLAIGHPIADNRKQFEYRYCNAQPTAFSKWDITGSINLEELSEKIKDGVLRRTKEECLDLPEKVYVVRNCEETTELEKAYNEGLKKLKDDYKERLMKGDIKGGGDAIVMLGYLRRLASIYKVNQTIEMVESLLDQNESVVVFSEFVESTEAIANHFGVTALTGKMKDEDRQKLKEDFQAGKTKVFVGTIRAGGVGITLTKACYNLIIDYPWTPGALQQAEDRIHRIGQKRTSFIYNIHAKEIDLIMAGIIGKKSESIDIVLQKHQIDLTMRDDDGFYPELLAKLLK